MPEGFIFSINNIPKGFCSLWYLILFFLYASTGVLLYLQIQNFVVLRDDADP